MHTPHPMESLLRQAQTGDPDARNQLLAWLRHALRPAAQGLLRNGRVHLDASDVLQEMCLRVHRTLAQLYPDCSVPQFLAWSQVILRNLVIGDLRRAAVRRHRGADQIAEVEDDGTSPEQRLLRAEREQRLEAALRRLPELQRRAFHLRLREGLTFEQVGQRLGVGLGRARVLFLRAVETLRGLLTESR